MELSLAVVVQSETFQSVCTFYKSADGNCSVPSSAEPSVVAVEGSCAEQSEQILQRQSLSGSVGACYQPARPMKPPGILMFCVHLGKSNCTGPVLMFVGLLGKCPRRREGWEGQRGEHKEAKRSSEFNRSG